MRPYQYIRNENLEQTASLLETNVQDYVNFLSWKVTEFNMTDNQVENGGLENVEPEDLEIYHRINAYVNRNNLDVLVNRDLETTTDQSSAIMRTRQVIEMYR